MANCVKIIMQGDAYIIKFKLLSEGQPININQISRIEFCVANLKKYYGQESDAVTYNDNDKSFYFPVLQSESLLMEGPQHIQVRVKDINNNVVGKIYGNILIQFSDSEVIL